MTKAKVYTAPKNIPKYKPYKAKALSELPKYECMPLCVELPDKPKRTDWKNSYKHHKFDIPARSPGELVGVKKKTLEDLYEEISKNYVRP